LESEGLLAQRIARQTLPVRRTDIMRTHPKASSERITKRNGAGCGVLGIHLQGCILVMRGENMSLRMF
jgi:hypothetical protein